MEGPSFEASLNDWVDSLQWIDTNFIDWVSLQHCFYGIAAD
jgi:hypothetical protein